MATEPRQPAEHPPEHHVDPAAAEHQEHGIPPEAHDDVPTGLPNSDRHHTEVTPTKPA